MEQVKKFADKVFTTLGAGFTERIYHNAMEVLLRKNNIPFQSEQNIPVMFEGTVLCTAYGMGFFFFWRNRLLLGVKNDLLDDRQTDDRMVIAIECVEGMNESDVLNTMKSNGAVELRELINGVQTTI
jgi:hypothetical protein